MGHSQLRELANDFEAGLPEHMRRAVSPYLQQVSCTRPLHLT